MKRYLLAIFILIIGFSYGQDSKKDSMLVRDLNLDSLIKSKVLLDKEYDKIFTVVQVPAEFPGGQMAWVEYLQTHLKANIPTRKHAPIGRYTVIVTFIIDKEGNIADVQAQNDPGYGTKEEAIRVILKGPKWIPATQNGKNVICRHRQSISFQVE